MIEPSSVVEKRSSTLARIRNWMQRPVAARLAEPLLYSLAFACYFAGTESTGPSTASGAFDHRAFALIAAGFLLARLVVDTAPNLVVCGRLEAVPYGEHYVRRSLARVKAKLTIAIALGCLLAVTFGVDLLGLASAPLPRNSLFLLVAALASYTITAPVVLAHRGVPTARPSIAPCLGAALFLTSSLLPGLDERDAWTAFLVCVLLGNLIGGGVQRYLAAARRIARPGSIHVQSTYDPIAHAMESEHATILTRALAVAPFLLLPVAPALFDLILDPNVPPGYALAAMLAAALPPILFDAKRPARRFRLTAYSMSAILLVAGAWVDDGSASRPLIDTGLLLLAYPPLNTLLARGARRSLISCVVTYALAKSVLAMQFPATPWPIAESLLVLLAMAAVLECGVAERNDS